jgi:hypothetical protein
MKLNVNERLVIVGILPEKGNFKTMTTVENAKNALHLTEEEVLKYELKQVGENLAWNKEGAKKKEIKISELGTEMIMEAFEALDKKSELTTFHYSVFKHLKDEAKKAEEVEVEKPKAKK